MAAKAPRSCRTFAKDNCGGGKVVFSSDRYMQSEYHQHQYLLSIEKQTINFNFNYLYFTKINVKL